MTQRKKCQRDGCVEFTHRSDAKYCSAQCGQLAGQSTTGDAFEVEGNTAQLTKTVREDVRTLEDLIRVCHIDQKVWTIKKWRCGKWATYFQVRAELERNIPLELARTEVDNLIAFAKKEIKWAPPVVQGAPDGVMLELSVPDVHVGKLAWAKETGAANYDSKIAVSCFEAAIESLLERTKHHKIAKIILPLGNDLLNADNAAMTTTGGTPQDTDARYHKTFHTVSQLMIRTIQRLERIAPVEVPIVPGNHDTLSAWHLGYSLHCFFHADQNVTIDYAPTMRKYVEFGKVGLMFTHGDKGKKDNMPLVLATEMREMFGRMKFNEIHLGHLHKTKVDEFNGVRVRILSALCPADAWHSENQFIGQLRSAEAFVWDADQGLIGTAIYTVPEEAAKAA